jgi:hypothetical protein
MDTLSDADVGLQSDEDVGLGPAASQSAAPMSDADVGLMSDEDVGLGPEPEGVVKSALRHAASSVVPGVAGLAGWGAGAEAGAALGTALMPGVGTAVGSVAGGAAGALVNAYLAQRAQKKAKEALGLDDEAQLAADAKAHPIASDVGDIGGSMVGMSPSAGASAMTRVAAGAAGAGVAAGQQIASGNYDPAAIALNAAAFAAAPSLNKFGAAVEGVGHSAVNKFVPGRPNFQHPVDASANQGTNVQNNQQEDPQVEAKSGVVKTAPNPQSTPTRSETLYGKVKNFVTGQKDTLTTGDVAPDIGTALAGDNQPGVAPTEAGNPLVRSTPNVPRPVEGNPGEQVPIDTGIQKAAATQPTGGPVDTGIVPPKPVTATVTNPEAPIDTGIETAAASVNRAKPTLTLTDRVNKAAQDANPQPTPGQIEAGNFQKGHPDGTFAGKKVSIENAAGSTRTSKPGATEPWEVQMPYHYGYLKGTRAADSTKAKPQGVDIAFDPEGGENHYVVDQKDADTGKFDEHKIFADTTTPDRVRGLYNAGFSDGRGPERLGALTRASEDDLKKWLADPAKKAKPFSKTFEEGVQPPVAPQEGEEPLTEKVLPSDANVTNSSQSIPSDDIAARAKAALAEGATAGEKPLPEVVGKALKAMRDAGNDKAADAFEALPPDEQVKKAATLYKIATTGVAPKQELAVPRVPGNRDNLKVKMGDKVVEAANKKEAATKQAAFDGLKAAFDKHVPVEGETPEATRDRAAALYKDAAQHMPKLRVADKPPEYALAKHARDLINTRIGVNKFLAEEKLLRDPDKSQGPVLAKQTNRITADIEKRRGPTAEQAMETHTQPDLEETPDSAEVKNVTSVEDLPTKKPDYDMSKPEDVEKIADALLEAGKTPAEPVNAPPKETVAEKIARQKAARLAAQEAGVKPPEAKNAYGKAAEAAHAKDAAVEAKAAEAARRSNIEQAAKKNGIVKDLYDHFIEPTPKGLGADAPDSSYWKKIVPAFSFARDAEPGAEQVGRYVNKDLAQLGKDSTNTKYDTMDWAKNLPDALKDPKARERAYLAWERNDLASLDPKEEAAFNSYIKPMLDKNDALYDAIEKLAPGLLGPKTLTNHAMRITKGSTADYNVLKEDDDPVAGRGLDLSAVGTRPKATGLARHFMALESDADGKRFVIGLNPDGYTVHVDGKATRIKDPDFKFEEGGKYKVGNDTYTMTQATTPEIEDNARFENGKRVSYYHDVAFSAGVAHQELSDLARGLVEMRRQQTQLQEYELAVPPGGKAQEGWRTTKLPNFAGWKMDPKIADVLDDFAKPGLNDSALDVVRRVNTALAKTLFWNPIPHMLNELTHAFVARGYRWLMPMRYGRMASTTAESLQSVINQDHFQKELADNGASLIYRPLRMDDFVRNFGKALGHEIESNPSKWDPIAQKFGVGPTDLVKAIYNNSSKILWASHDVMITQGVKERMAEGMSMRDAIVDLERHMPNYTIPAQVMGGGSGGRTISKLLREKGLFMFGNYHEGVWNSYANIFKDVVHGNGRDKAEAAGNIVALAALGGIYYAMDKVARKLTGNPDASQQRRGPLAVPSHIAAALRGEEDPTSFARSTFTTAPLTTAAWQLLTGGKDYNNKAIIDPGTISKAAHGSPKAAAKALGQAADWTARSSISPYSTVTNAWHKGENPGAALRDQLTDEKNPSPAARKWLHQLPKKNAQGERSRERHPAGLIEATINKLVGH